AKMLERFKKPTFVIEEMGEEAKGSARSYGDFSAADAIRAAENWLIKGGGHKLAAGVTLKTAHIPQFRKAINDFYHSLGLKNQLAHLEPKIDAIVDNFAELNHELVTFLKTLEPYGHGNPEPVFHVPRAVVHARRTMGKDNSHLKLEIGDMRGNRWSLIGFGQAETYPHDVGDEIAVWFTLLENEWRGRTTLEGQLIKINS
ncbi:MAG TPA: DHHA1 domain-containing protein, partial [Magnetospirillaceae bacterium]|nr:DHHA1 domain-containing protein [Magnetospirillaceae bacterium]